jgi:hypothetical protein
MPIDYEITEETMETIPFTVEVLPKADSSISIEEPCPIICSGKETGVFTGLTDSLGDREKL